jgi:hypothetical protein
MDDAAGWQPEPGLDPDADDRGRPWDSDGDGGKGAWPDEVRPDGLDLGSLRPPDHVLQLHRAMSEAAEDLDAVEDRLSTLFERTEGPGQGSAPRPAPVEQSTLHPEFAVGAGTPDAADDDDDEIFDLFEDGDVEEADDEVGFAQHATVTDRRAIIGEYEDDIGGDFAALDAELVAEEPDGPAEPKRRMFRRRAKGTTTARR